jgi:hypothetical protein
MSSRADAVMKPNLPNARRPCSVHRRFHLAQGSLRRVRYCRSFGAGERTGDLHYCWERRDWPEARPDDDGTVRQPADYADRFPQRRSADMPMHVSLIRRYGIAASASQTCERQLHPRGGRQVYGRHYRALRTHSSASLGTTRYADFCGSVRALPLRRATGCAP